jgi:hypothetical protein
MLNIALVQPMSVGSLLVGSLFMPSREGDQHFIAGAINQVRVLVCLDGERPFIFGQEWNRGPGFAVPGIRFEVDPTSAHPADEEANAGSLVKIGGATAIMGANAEQRSSTAYAIYLQEPERWVDISRGDIAFTRWRIVAGEGRDAIELLSVNVDLD